MPAATAATTRAAAAFELVAGVAAEWAGAVEDQDLSDVYVCAGRAASAAGRMAHPSRWSSTSPIACMKA
jgi:hypothetical protein